MNRWGRRVFLALLLLGTLEPIEAAPRRGKFRSKKPSPVFRIRHIRIVRRDIFDTNIPSENKKIFRAVNALHFSTKEGVIRDELLLKEGDVYNADLAKESERALRSILRLREVKVTPLPVNKSTVDVLVTSQETWTTEPVFSLSGVGSNLNLKAGLRERNLLGYGKNASYFYRETDGIISRTFSYEDPRFFRTPLRLDADYQDREDGTLRFLSLEKPFFATITPWSLGFSGLQEKNEEKERDNLGREIAKLDAESTDGSLNMGFSMGSTTRRVRRQTLGYQYLKDSLHTRIPTRIALRKDRFHAFSVGYHWELVDFLTVNRIKQYDRDEDFAMGPSYDLSFGAARHRWIPTSENANFFKGKVLRGKRYGVSHFGLWSATGEGKLQKERWRGATISSDIEYYNHFEGRQTLACHLGGAAIVNPAKGDQILLGGDTGLRGYRLNQFAGNKKLLANIENRFFVVDDVFRFMSLGAVLFSDAGYVWGAGQNVRLKDIKMDFGTGIRFYLNRTSLGHVLRLDLAYAVKRVPDQNRMVVTFGSEHAF
jgi:outer membrane protein assembly factor BamA